MDSDWVETLPRTLDDEANSLRDVKILLDKALGMMPAEGRNLPETTKAWDAIADHVVAADSLIAAALKEIGAS